MSNPAQDPAQYDRIFKALGSAVRRRILDDLRDQPLTTGTLVAHFPELDRCTVMQHLNVLEEADLVIPVRRGRERWIGPHAAGAVARIAALKRELEWHRKTAKPVA
jgi:DNA-binding transcriptional ArsR family regulator